MSESFPAAVGRANYGKYIDQIQEELKKIIEEVGTGKTSAEVERTQVRLQELFRTQSNELSKEVGFAGNHVLAFMTATAIIATAWVSFYLRRATSDLSKSPEDRLALVDMLESMNLALQRVIEESIKHADLAQQ
jgi:hypothetical protein